MLLYSGHEHCPAVQTADQCGHIYSGGECVVTQ